MFKLPKEALLQQWAPLPLRLMLGYGFMAHGWAKLCRGPAGFATDAAEHLLLLDALLRARLFRMRTANASLKAIG